MNKIKNIKNFLKCFIISPHEYIIINYYFHYLLIYFKLYFCKKKLKKTKKNIKENKKTD